MARDPGLTAHRLREIMQDRECDQSDLADSVGISQSAISQILNGLTRNSRHLPKIAENLAINLSYLAGTSDERIDMFDANGDPMTEDDLLRRGIGIPTRSGSKRGRTAASEKPDVIPIREIDLRYGMGATELEVPVTTTVRHFSREWIRLYTGASPDHLYFAQGIGDSMSPTILDSDLLLVDASQQALNLADKIWACAYGNSGMVKRLRQMADGSVKIMSDNQNVRDEIAYDGELHVLGRVVAIVRKT
ncbi:S24 family peptidase [Sphingobium yanoikuyae]|nr:S24 family peptidase [Sphingobium yanoikuyae]